MIVVEFLARHPIAVLAASAAVMVASAAVLRLTSDAEGVES